ncbi:MAG TPA: hypothetical protein VFY70_08100 [Thermomicrobiales bacterium]|nr:hypothetical protein [Thermomicrobiales bacterium]
MKKTFVRVGVPVVAVAFVVALFLKEVALRTIRRQSAEADTPDESAPAEALSAGLQMEGSAPLTQ